MENQGPVRIFIIYSSDEDDKKFKDDLVLGFKPMENKNRIEVFHDGEIMAGQDWDQTIKDKLNKSDLILVLVSRLSMASTYISKNELPISLERRDKGEVDIVPIIIATSDFPSTQLAKLQFHPKGKEPLLNWKDRNAAVDSVVQRIKVNIGEIEKKRGLPNLPAIDSIPATPIFTSPDPEALCICVQNEKTVTIFPPKSNGSESFDLPEFDFHAKVANILQRLMLLSDLDGVDLLESEDFTVLGKALFHHLLPDEKARGIVQPHLDNATQYPLKIVLHFDENSKKMAALPWEYLYVPSRQNSNNSSLEGFFIAKEENIVLTRRLSGGRGKENLIRPPQLRILVVISKPEPTVESEKILDEAQEIESLFKVWKEEHPTMSPPQIVPLQANSLDIFKNIIAENDPFHVVHFIGKGCSEKDENGQEKNSFLFESGNKLSPEEFVACFETEDGKKKQPNLLFLHAIRDDRGSVRSLRKMALDLVNKVDGVLAIQLPATGKEIADFAVAFYAELASGQDLDVAAAKAARKLVGEKTKILKMYGISASFSKDSFRIEVGVTPVERMDSKEGFYSCYNTRSGRIRCKDSVFFNFRVPSYCENELCVNGGPFWLCPLCQRATNLNDEDKKILADLSKEKCRNGHFIRQNGQLINEILEKLPDTVKEELDKKSLAPISTMGDQISENTPMGRGLGGSSVHNANTGGAMHIKPGEARRERPNKK